MRIGFGTGITSAQVLRPARTPRSLFRRGDQGAWFDPSDLSTLAQDSSGIVPVTALGQSVGRMLDKSGNNAHAAQTTADWRPLYARIPRGSVRNLFRNSRFAGFLPGPLDSFSTMSEGTAISTTGGAGSPRIEIAGIGTDTMGEWIDVRVHGANSTASARFINIVDEMPVGASQGTARIISADLQVRSNLGPNTPTVRLFSHWRSATNSQLIGGDDPMPAPTTTMTRYRSLVSTAPANTAMMRNKGVYIRCAAAEAFDYTLRIRRMQVEFSQSESAYQATRLFGADAFEQGQPHRFALLNDQINDALMVTLPAGTYTVAYANDAGVTIQTGQALAGPYSMPVPPRLYACLFINRALSETETSSLTAWFNSKRP